MFVVFFFNDTATAEIYTLSLHDALPIYVLPPGAGRSPGRARRPCRPPPGQGPSSRASQDRKSTRLNSSHPSISYAVFCLKKKKNVLAELSIQQSNTSHNLTVLLATMTAV